MLTDREQLRTYYANGKEWVRLESDEGWLEYHRTAVLIDRYIPAGSRVLDLGGGPGRYTVALATRGDTVTLVDLSPEQIAEAKTHLDEAGLSATALVGDAASLSGIPGAPFDAVLALGPLYHAADLDELQVFVDQIAGVLKPGGVVLAAFIPRTSGVSGLIARAAGDPDQIPSGALRQTFETGRFVNAKADKFGEAFFAHPEQVYAALVGDFEMVGIFSLRGLGAGYGAQLRQLYGKPIFAEVMALIDETAHRPDVIGLGWHAVAVGRRRG